VAGAFAGGEAWVKSLLASRKKPEKDGINAIFGAFLQKTLTAFLPVM
jgi:hypothetical protein